MKLVLRTVIDTNITVSGLLFGGLPLKIIRAALARKFIWVTSPALMEETERVLRSEKFGLSEQEIQALSAPVFGVAEITVPVNSIQAIPRCPAYTSRHGAWRPRTVPARLSRQAAFSFPSSCSFRFNSSSSRLSAIH